MALCQKTINSLLDFLSKQITNPEVSVDGSMNIIAGEPLPVIMDGAGIDLTFQYIDGNPTLIIFEKLGNSSLLSIELFDRFSSDIFQLQKNIDTNQYLLYVGKNKPIIISEEIESKYDLVSMGDLFNELQIEYEDYIG